MSAIVSDSMYKINIETWSWSSLIQSDFSIMRISWSRWILLHFDREESNSFSCKTWQHSIFYVIYKWAQWNRAFIPGKPSKLSVIYCDQSPKWNNCLLSIKFFSKIPFHKIIRVNWHRGKQSGESGKSERERER